MIKNFLKKTYRSLKMHNEVHRLGTNNVFYTVTESTNALTNAEKSKIPYRFDVINLLTELVKSENYLEIGVRNPDDNFNLIKSKNKYSVDPGLEFKSNPVDFQMTSDEFFLKLRAGQLKLENTIKFDVIFIDGLHLAEQVEKDIVNSIEFLSENGFIVLHDCNPPTQFHGRENFEHNFTPAGGSWNGTTWKAFVDARTKYYSCCVDTDWGVGVISKKPRANFSLLENNTNRFFEYNVFDSKRKEQLNLLDFASFSESMKNLKS